MTAANLRHLRLVRSTTRPAMRAFGAMPAWVLLSQLFLAIAWLRAAAEKVIATDWWAGDVVARFLTEDTAWAVSFYEPFLARVVEPHPAVIAVIVVIAELVIGALLLANRHVPTALAGGAFLNVHFMLAGAVNPSVFYLVLTMGIVLWRVEAVPASTRRRVARGVATAAAVTTVGLAPFIATLRPAEAIEDPALVLIFLALLLAAAVWADPAAPGRDRGPPVDGPA